MTTFAINRPDDLMRFQHFMGQMEYPFVATATKEKDRTKAQNRTVHKWYGEIAAHLGDVTAQEVKAECNLIYGLDIMRRDAEWDSVFGYIFDSLNHLSKLKAIRVLDIPFTRRMKVGELSEYMDQMHRDYTKRGVSLTMPEGA